MKIRATVLSLAIGAMALGAGFGCEHVKEAASGTEHAVTGDVSKPYPYHFEDAKSAVMATAKDMGLVVIDQKDDLDKDARKRFTLKADTKEQKHVNFDVVRLDDKRTNITVDTPAFSSADYRSQVIATVEKNLKQYTPAN